MKRMRWLALLAIFSLIAAACSAADDDDAADDTDDDTSAADAEEPDASDETPDEDPEDDPDEDAMEEPAEIATDFGVTEDTIRVGMSADLSGIFAPLVTVIVDAQTAYFDRVNANGGIAGREVELVILDSGYDVPTHLDNYAELADESEDGVVMIGHSTGSPHTSAIAGDLANDDLIAVPVTWYSGWADPEFGGNVFELYSNYCFEGMNGVEFLAEQSDAEAPTLAVLSFPGEYGQDGAAGAKIAAEQLGLEIVYDGEAEVTPGGDDFTSVISQLVDADPDIVWITANSSALAQILGGATAQGLDAIWSGNSPTYNPALLGSEVADPIDQFYFHSTYTALWNSNDSAGMQDMVATLTEALPEATYAQADTFITGWTFSMFVEAVLEQAAANGDMTRAGVVAAANEVEVDFQGLAPDQSWSGDPNDFAIRGTYIYDVTAADATLTTAITEAGSSGLTLVEENFTGTVAEGYDFQQACFISEG